MDTNNKRDGTAPLTPSDSYCPLDRALQLERDIADLERASAMLRALIANDAYAMSFQAMGQYRTALLTNFRRRIPPILDRDDTAHATFMDSVSMFNPISTQKI